MSEFDSLVTELLATCRQQGLRIATAESCTGGLVAAALTEIAGSSDVYVGGVNAYANDAKTTLLGVPAALIAREGAVSAAVARAMAEGARQSLGVDIAVSITGIAGPGGGSLDKPVGLVWFGLAIKDGDSRALERRFGAIGRAMVRRDSVKQALQLLVEACAP
ncbi:MAG: CinA family protein [Sphingomonadales bacterium]